MSISCIRQPVNLAGKNRAEHFFSQSRRAQNRLDAHAYQGCIRATRKKLREIQPDIVHGQGTELDCGLSAAFSGFPNVLTIHGNMKAIAKIYRARLCQLSLAGRAHGNPHLANWRRLLQLRLHRGTGGPARAKNLGVPNALRPDFFAPCRYRKTPASRMLLNIGVLIEPTQAAVGDCSRWPATCTGAG